MYILKIISIVLIISIFNGCANKDVKPSVEIDENNVSGVNTTMILDENSTALNESNVTLDEVDENSTISIDNNLTMEIDENSTTSNESNATMEVYKYSEFEKLFVNHSAHLYYLQGIDDLYEKNYKAAYENAMKAKEIFDNTELQEQVIPLPYMPSYLRESAYRPKKIYYKIIKPKPYKLKRLIIKAKLISPPIPSVVIKKTSTYIDVIVRNYGDLPLDEFEVLLNGESIGKFDKILPNEEIFTRIEDAPIMYEISFKEKYGFAPTSIMLSKDD